MIRKELLVAGLMLATGVASAAEYQGYVRGTNIHENGDVSVYMSSDTQSLTQCAGPFDTTGFKFVLTDTNSHVVSKWIPMLEASRQAKFDQEGATSLPHPATNPATVKVGYTVESSGVCTINYVYNLNWFNL